MSAAAATRRLSSIVAIAATLAAGACGDDPNGLEELAGNYTATFFTTTEAGQSTNQLTEGASVTMNLASNGTTTGSLVIPPSSGGPETLDLTGTWARNGNIVTFSHAADTFIRDMDFTVNGRTLVGDRLFDDVRVQLTLTR